jgi:hypothetical protein
VLCGAVRCGAVRCDRCGLVVDTVGAGAVGAVR